MSDPADGRLVDPLTRNSKQHSKRTLTDRCVCMMYARTRSWYELPRCRVDTLFWLKDRFDTNLKSYFRAKTIWQRSMQTGVYQGESRGKEALKCSGCGLISPRRAPKNIVYDYCAPPRE
jgi:hypothetical protein